MSQPQTAKTAYRDYQDIGWVNSTLRPILIAVLCSALLAGPLAIVSVVSRWQLDYVLPLGFIAALEATYSTVQRGRPNWRDRRGVLFRFGELALLLILLRLTEWGFSGSLPGTETLYLWLRRPGTFFDDRYVLTAILLLLAWVMAILTTGDFLELAIRPDEVAAHQAHSWEESPSQQRAFQPTSREEIMQRFMTRFGLGGILLVFCAAASHLTVDFGDKGMIRLGLAQLGLPANVLVALICYFLSGLLLASQARLAILRSQWYNQNVDVLPAVSGRWHLNSILVLILVGGLAALLPIGPTGWLATFVEAIIALLMRITAALIFVLLVFLSLLLMPLRLLQGERSQLGPQQMPDLQIPTQAQAASSLPDWLGGAILWVVLGAIVTYFLLGYLRAHGILAGNRWPRWMVRLILWGRARRARWNASVRTTVANLRERLRPLRRRETGTAPRRFFRPASSDPRELVRYFYLRMVNRAGELGLSRPPHQTPLEFTRDIEAQWPEAEMDVEALTGAFLQARYDRRPVRPEDAQATGSAWQRLRQVLRGRSPGRLPQPPSEE